MNSIKARLRGIKSGRRELRLFGLTVGGAFCVVSLLMLWKNYALFPYFVAAGLALITAGLLAPPILKPLQKVWMAVSIILGLAVTTVLLILIFYLIITPLGLAARLAGRRTITRGFDRTAETYWIRRTPDTQSRSGCEKQF